MKFIIGYDSDGQAIHVDPFIMSDTRTLITAQSGLGKSWLLRVIAEHSAAHIQTVIIDPAGEFATLREKLDILVVSTNGDIQPDIRSAPLLARRLCETGVSAVIDIYDLPGKGDPWDKRRLFVGQFINALMEVPKSLYHPMLIKIDEAHMFAPEGKGGGGEKLAEYYIGEKISPSTFSLSAVNLLMSGGRKYGFGGLLATQRISKINKDAIADARNKFLGGATLDNDQRRTGDELGMTKAESVVLRELDPGQFYAYGPAIQKKGVVFFRSAPVQTTHPKAGQRSRIVVPKASTQIKAIVDQLGDIPAAAEEEIQTMESLKRENLRLHRELDNRPQVEIPKPEKVVQTVEVSVFTDENKETLEDIQARIEKLRAPFDQLNDSIKSMGEDFSRSMSMLSDTLQDAFSRINTKPLYPKNTVTGTVKIDVEKLYRKDPVAIRSSDNESSLPEGQEKILQILAQYPDGVTPRQLTVLTGYARSTRNTYIQKLGQRSAIQKRSGRIYITQEGRQMLGTIEPLPEPGPELQEYWLSTLPLGERTILKVLIDVWPNDVTREYIGDLTGYERSTRNTYLQKMSAKEIITATGPGRVKASDHLFRK